MSFSFIYATARIRLALLVFAVGASKRGKSVTRTGWLKLGSEQIDWTCC